MKSKWIIPVDQVPSNICIHQYILEKTDLKKIAQSFPKSSFLFKEIPVTFDFKSLQREILDLVSHYELHPFQYGKQITDASYLSTSLTWNPNSIDAVSLNPHQGTLGSTLYKSNSALHIEKLNPLKNSYNDTYAFTTRTPISKEGKLGEFLDSFNHTLVRSRISVIKNNCPQSTDLSFGWHNDENIFINLRINIPIQTNENYCIQILENETLSPDDKSEIVEFAQQEGHAYIYDTEKFHRPYCKKLNPADRIQLITGISPWFDYDEEKKSWVSNEFYGELHPFDIFLNGYVSPYLKK